MKWVLLVLGYLWLKNHQQPQTQASSGAPSESTGAPLLTGSLVIGDDGSLQVNAGTYVPQFRFLGPPVRV